MLFRLQHNGDYKFSYSSTDIVVSIYATIISLNYTAAISGNKVHIPSIMKRESYYIEVNGYDG